MTTINRIRTISEDTLKRLINRTNTDRKEIETLIKYGDIFLCLPPDHTITFKKYSNPWTNPNSCRVFTLTDKAGYTYNSIYISPTLSGIYKWSVNGSLLPYLDRFREWWNTGKWPRPRVEIEYYRTVDELRSGTKSFIKYYEY